MMSNVHEVINTYLCDFLCCTVYISLLNLHDLFPLLLECSPANESIISDDSQNSSLVSICDKIIFPHTILELVIYHLTKAIFIDQVIHV